jgi:hypothetical protein
MTIRVDPEKNEIGVLFDFVDLDGRRVLEIGSGDGRLTSRYADRAATVTAVEPFAPSVTRGGVSEGVARRRDATRVPQMCPECVRVFNEPTTTKCPFAGTLSKALWRARTADPLLTILGSRQLVAINGNGFRLFPPFSRLRHLPPVATGCACWAP